MHLITNQHILNNLEIRKSKFVDSRKQSNFSTNMQSSLSSIHGKRFHISKPITKPNSPPSKISLLHLPHLPSSPSSLSISSSYQIIPQSTQTHSNPPFHHPIWTSKRTKQSIIPSPRPHQAQPLSPLLCGISSNTLSPNEGGRGFRGWIEAVGEALSTAFPLWVALGCLVGLLKPGSYNWVQPQWTIMGITVTMLGMGMTLTFDDLRGALAMPKELITGFVLQYSVSSILSLTFCCFESMYMLVRGRSFGNIPNY